MQPMGSSVKHLRVLTDSSTSQQRNTLAASMMETLILLSECADRTEDDTDESVNYNDADCVCDTSVELLSFIEHLIPSPFFEEHDSCPFYIIQLSFCDDWQQATSTTSDDLACGVKDGHEVNPTGTHPLAEDSDGDGIDG